jgi:hypothetical protein
MSRDGHGKVSKMNVYLSNIIVFFERILFFFRLLGVFLEPFVCDIDKQPFMASLNIFIRFSWTKFKKIEPEFGQNFRHDHKWS